MSDFAVGDVVRLKSGGEDGVVEAASCDERSVYVRSRLGSEAQLVPVACLVKSEAIDSLFVAANDAVSFMGIACTLDPNRTTGLHEAREALKDAMAEVER